MQQKTHVRVAAGKPSGEDVCVAVMLTAQSSSSVVQITATIVMQMVSVEQGIWGLM